MTADQIERKVERFFDHLDAKLMNGSISQADYDTASKEIAKWADDQYAQGEHTS